MIINQRLCWMRCRTRILYASSAGMPLEELQAEAEKCDHLKQLWEASLKDAAFSLRQHRSARVQEGSDQAHEESW